MPTRHRTASMPLYSARPPQTPPSQRSVPLRRSSRRTGGRVGWFGIALVMGRAWPRPDGAGTGERLDRPPVPGIGVVPRPDSGCRHAWLRNARAGGRPGGSGAGGRAGALPGADPVVGLHATAGVLPQPGRALRTLVAGVLARQPAAAERTPRQHAQAVVQAGGDDLELDVPDQQAVARLQGDRGGGGPARRCRSSPGTTTPARAATVARQRLRGSAAALRRPATPGVAA